MGFVLPICILSSVVLHLFEKVIKITKTGCSLFVDGMMTSNVVITINPSIITLSGVTTFSENEAQVAHIVSLGHRTKTIGSAELLLHFTVIS